MVHLCGPRIEQSDIDDRTYLRPTASHYKYPLLCTCLKRKKKIVLNLLRAERKKKENRKQKSSLLFPMDPLAQLSLPAGFRFFPTDEELLVHYLCRKVAGHHFSLPLIAEVDLYKFDPWALPGKIQKTNPNRYKNIYDPFLF